MQKIYLGKKAVGYIRDRLEDGLTLSKLILASLDLDHGEVFTFLPPGLPEAAVEDFPHGGKLPQPPPSEWRFHESGSVMKPIPKAIPELSKTIQDFLGGVARRPICLIENELAFPTDPWLTRRVSKVIFYEQEVYHVLTAASSTEEHIVRTIKEAESIPIFVGALATLDPEFVTDLEAVELISLHELKAVARRVEMIFVGAYDGESYLIWRKTGGKGSV